jgi:hypothetical protein
LDGLSAEPDLSRRELVEANRFRGLYRFKFTLRRMAIAIGFFAIDFSVWSRLHASTEPFWLANWGVGLAASGYLFAAFLAFNGAE